MIKQSPHKRLTAWLLTLVMLLSLLPTTALAADYPGPTYVSVDGGKSFTADKLYFRNGGGVILALRLQSSPGMRWGCMRCRWSGGR